MPSSAVLTSLKERGRDDPRRSWEESDPRGFSFQPAAGNFARFDLIGQTKRQKSFQVEQFRWGGNFPVSADYFPPLPPTHLKPSESCSFEGCFIFRQNFFFPELNCSFREAPLFGEFSASPFFPQLGTCDWFQGCQLIVNEKFQTLFEEKKNFRFYYIYLNFSIEANYLLKFEIFRGQKFVFSRPRKGQNWKL